MLRGEKGGGSSVPSGRSTRRAFVQSVLVEALNPKAALFYLAFLPQFVDPGAALPLWAQFLILGWIVNLTFSAADLVTIWLTGLALNYARDTGLAGRAMRVIGGCTLMGLGARLAFSED